MGALAPRHGAQRRALPLTSCRRRPLLPPLQEWDSQAAAAHSAPADSVRDGSSVARQL